MRLTGFRIRNFKMFRDVSVRNLPPLAIFVGANASGKSTLFDVFRFLRDLFSGKSLQDACDDRGGFNEILSRGAEESFIEIALDFLMSREGGKDEVVEYMIRLDSVNDLLFVAKEHVICEKDTPILSFNYDADTENGKASFLIVGEQLSKKKLSDLLQRKTLQFSVKEGRVSCMSLLNESHIFLHSFVLDVRRWVADFFDEIFDQDSLRSQARLAGIDRFSRKGDNLPLVAKRIRKKNPREFEAAVSALRRCAPDIKDVEPVIAENGYVFLRFVDRNFDRPFNSFAMSDGTILAFARLLLFFDLKNKLVCVDEVERSLYPEILRHLLVEMRKYAQTGSSQVMVSTHSPDLLNYAELDEIFWLAKKDGCTQIHRAKDDEEVSAFVENGDLPGWVWRKGLFAGADPESKVE